jgi:hypothetical protein
LGDSNLEKLKEVLTLERGHDEIIPETSLYPIAFHDGRTWKAKPGNATYKTLAKYVNPFLIHSSVVGWEVG